jgi:hypothetical protein
MRRFLSLWCFVLAVVGSSLYFNSIAVLLVFPVVLLVVVTWKATE